MRFPYRAYDVQPSAARPSPTTLYRPVIPVRVLGANADAVLFGLVDTGADETVLPGFLVRQLGIDADPRRVSPFRGVGGQVVPVSFGRITLELGTGRRSYRWETDCGFLDGPTVAVLGQRGFLEYLKATFNSERRELTLIPITNLTRRRAA